MSALKDDKPVFKVVKDDKKDKGKKTGSAASRKGSA